MNGFKSALILKRKIMILTYLFPVLWTTILFCGNYVTAKEVQAPQSLEGANLEIFGRKEEYECLQNDVFLNLKDGLSWEGSEDRITRYEPKGNTALITLLHIDKKKEDYSSGEYEKNPALFKRYYISGETSYDRAQRKNPKPATIVFTDKGGHDYYKGILQGYLTCDKKQKAENLTSLPVVILLGEEKDQDPELVKLLEQLKNAHGAREANWSRQELVEYWKDRLNKVYQELINYYSNFPVTTEKLKTAQSDWETSYASMVIAYVSCLTGGDEKEEKGQWFEANMLKLDYDTIKQRCRFLENMLDLIKMNDL